MKEHLKNLPEEIQELITKAREVSVAQKAPMYLVGGFVRDLILGVENLDLDFVVEGDAIKFAEHLSIVLKARLIAHPRFGTATLIYKQHAKIDIATARTETYPHPASLPVVTAGTIKDDLKRRDFSINAMAISLNGDDLGKRIDYFHGLRDIRDKKIRILHPLSLVDDPTRMLRAIRFEQRFNFSIEPETLSLFKQALKQGMLDKVQPQRIRDEIILMLKEARPLKSVKRLGQLAGFDFISPRLKLGKKSYLFLRLIEKQIYWYRLIYRDRRSLDEWLLYFFGLVDFLDKKGVQGICESLVFCKGDKLRISSYKGISRDFIKQLSKGALKPAKIFQMLEPLSYEVILALKAKYKDRALQKHIEDFFEIYNGMRLLVSGHDLHSLGLAPGPRYQAIFSKVLSAKINGAVKTRDEELALIKELI